MRKRLIYGITIVILGLLISLGPQFIFKVCAVHEDSFPMCHWSAQAEIGMGILISALGCCLLIFDELKTQLGLSIGIFLASIIALCIPHVLIGGCGMMTMACRRIAFPAIPVECVVLLVFSAVVAVCIEMKKNPAGSAEV